MKTRDLIIAVLLTAASSVASAMNRADILKNANAVRRDCGARNIAPLILNEALSKAGEYMQRGADLEAALKRAEYRADRSAVIRLGGRFDDKSLSNLLRNHYCDVLGDAALTVAGIYSEGKYIWLLLAKPFVVPPARDAAKVANEVLLLVNEARSKPRRCGSERFGATNPLTLNDKLTLAALKHSQDMAKRGNASHEGSDGSSPGDRATRAGYIWRDVGENVAAGQLNADEVVRGWLSSPHHCANIMAPEFVELGVAFAVNPTSKQGIYWTQVFGRTR